MEISKEDHEDLVYAKGLLENPGLVAKIVAVAGRPIEKSLAMLPENWMTIVHDASRKALEKALDYAIRTLERRSQFPAFVYHKSSVALSGGLAGAVGLAALPFELPFSTVMMLRSIADIARSEGEDIQNPETKLAMLEVFALGGGTQKDEAAETGYYAVRTSLAALVSDATSHFTGRRIAGRGSPLLLRLLDSIASRFGIVVSQKAMATAVPVVGAASGAIINMIFLNHFQDIARGHFIVRRLERKYGQELIRSEYNDI
ncbi:MAG: EcsC family protein [Candidatus Abyssobacteria bacterium SURF_5]|uniref:EcsC family protein n=1 Tax=Abyssobacteria bacterium (strain SURF_5) TaxID=2093360 RepID=A0A3A4NP60_ABYX5|nr:MAG: EcsC family protein [Candidatus Abyssubacteria bacterium SURF_5]